MLDKILASEITPERLFRSRRQFIKSAGALAAGAAVLAACGTEATAPTNAGGGGRGPGAPGPQNRGGGAGRARPRRRWQDRRAGR